MLQVLIRQVVLDLSHQLLDELRVRRLPALLLQLPSAGPGAAVCGKTTCIVVSRDSPLVHFSATAECFISSSANTTTVTHFTFINTISQRLTSYWQEYIPALSFPSAVSPLQQFDKLQSAVVTMPRCQTLASQCPTNPETAKTSPSEGRRVTDSPSHTEYGGSPNRLNTNVQKLVPWLRLVGTI